ncbi:MAG: type II toxin-antitoxin system YafQ family toxin [Verrucomicrobia bacterium]|nr:type II toxin-antitoxin system YafQ family toxin [Verrucomicrobiota bacterium]
MLSLEYATRFKRDFKLIQKRGLEIGLLQEAIALLAREVPLPEKFHDHALAGNWRGFRECHIRPDWLLIYKAEAGTLLLYRTGTHSDLFR